VFPQNAIHLAPLPQANLCSWRRETVCDQDQRLNPDDFYGLRSCENLQELN
jgi:hypothetical protein